MSVPNVAIGGEHAHFPGSRQFCTMTSVFTRLKALFLLHSEVISHNVSVQDHAASMAQRLMSLRPSHDAVTASSSPQSPLLGFSVPAVTQKPSVCLSQPATTYAMANVSNHTCPPRPDRSKRPRARVIELVLSSPNTVYSTKFRALSRTKCLTILGNVFLVFLFPLWLCRSAAVCGRLARKGLCYLCRAGYVSSSASASWGGPQYM